MKNLIVGMSMALVASATSGCIISSDSTELGRISATWHVDHVTTSGTVTPSACPTVNGVPIDTAALHTVAASSDGLALDACVSANSNCYIDLFTCDDNAGLSAELTNHDGSLVYTTSTAEFVNITNVDMNFNTDILIDGGYFKLAWSLQGEQSHQTITCSQTAAAKSAGGSVETIATINGTGAALTDKFDCEDHFGYSAPLPWGSYTIAVDALNSANQALGSQSTTLTNQVLGSQPNYIDDLGHVIINISGM